MFGDRSICSLALSLASSSMSPSRTAVPRLEDIPETRPKRTCSREGARSSPPERHRPQAEKRASKWEDCEWSTTYSRREAPYLKGEEVVGVYYFIFGGGNKISFREMYVLCRSKGRFWDILILRKKRYLPNSSKHDKKAFPKDRIAPTTLMTFGNRYLLTRHF